MHKSDIRKQCLIPSATKGIGKLKNKIHPKWENKRNSALVAPPYVWYKQAFELSFYLNCITDPCDK